MKQTLTIYLFSLLILFLVSCGSSSSSFFKNIKNNKITSVEKAQELIDKGADINEKDNKDNTLLHVVSSVELAKFLLEQGLDKEAKNNEGETPLYTTIKRRHYDVALFLKKKGADGFATTNNQRESPYNLANKHLREGNLNTEEIKQLSEILRLTWRDKAIID